MAGNTLAVLALVAVVLAVTLSGSVVEGQVRTTKSTLRSSYSFARSLSNPNEANPVNGAFVGAQKRPLIVNQTMVLATESALIQFDWTKPLNETSFYYRIYSNLPILSGAVRLDSADDRIVGISGTPVRVAYLTFNDTHPANNSLLYITPITPPPGYPPRLDPLDEDVNAILQHPDHTAEPFFYIIAGHFMARVRYDLDFDVIALPENVTAVTAEYDHVNKEIWIASTQGHIVRMNVSNTAELEQLWEIYHVGETVSLVHVAVDTKHGFIYAASAGLSQSNPSKVYKLSWSTGALLANITLERREYDIRAGFTDVERGIMYLATSSDAPRFVQIDLPGFYREYTSTFAETGPRGLTQVTSDVGSVSWMWGDVVSGKLYYGGRTKLLIDSMLLEYQMSEGCLGNCYGHGTCDNRYCTCESFNSTVSNTTLHYLQPWCFGHECDFNCNNNGYCTEFSVCNCNDTWTGTYCETPQCPRNCSGHGACQYDANDYPEFCSCDEGFMGRACDQSTFLPCYRLENCDECTANPTCGWCADIGACLGGDAIGPNTPRAGCRRWYFGDCNLVTEIVNYILTALVGILILICMISLMLEYTGPDGSRRDIWYRFQRSQKAWTLLFQFQLIGSLTFLAIPLPPIFANFTKYWAWSLFGIGLPFATNLAVPSTGAPVSSARSLLNVDQYVSYSLNSPDLILLGVLFWVGIITAIVFVLFFLSLIIAVIRGREAKQILQQYPIYIILKVVDVAYYPLVLFSCVQMVFGDTYGGVAALGAVVFVVIGLGYPVFIILITKFVGKALFKSENKIRLFSVHGHVPPKALMLAFIPTVRKLLIACAIGFLSRANNIAQLVLAIVVQIAFVLLIIFKSDIYSDYLQRYIEIFLGVINIIAYAVVIAFTADLNGIGITAITLVYIILVFIAVIITAAFFIIIWLQAREVYSCNQCIACIKGETPADTSVFEMK